MTTRRYWILDGRLLPTDDAARAVGDDAAKFQRGGVRVTTGKSGAEIKWDLQSPCIAGLLMACCHINSNEGPFLLRFYNAGWFEEWHTTAEKARRRVEDLLVRGDRQLGSKAFIYRRELSTSNLPPLITHTLKTGSVSDSYVVTCARRSLSEPFVVQNVGNQSIMGRIWGVDQSSAPYQTRGTFHATVSPAYAEVAETGILQYDQVLAPLRFPDLTLRWLPYHRLVMPCTATGSSFQMVKVVAEIGRLDTQFP
jgi:hypothetical protein